MLQNTWICTVINNLLETTASDGENFYQTANVCYSGVSSNKQKSLTEQYHNISHRASTSTRWHFYKLTHMCVVIATKPVHSLQIHRIVHI